MAERVPAAAHLSAGQVGSTVMAAALNKLSSIVSQVAITALDITGAAPADYVQIVHGCLAIQKCVGIIVRTLNTGLSVSLLTCTLPPN